MTDPSRPPDRTWLFGVSVFVSAGLLFVVQPMTARRLLPAFGGAASVWTTCVLFFQVGLVLGYALAHAIASLPRHFMQVLAYGCLIAVALLMGQRGPDVARLDALARGGSPAWGLLGILLGWVGLPYLALSAASPLLQSWLGRGEGRAGRDPYVLYAASNAGSLAALAAYPIWIERSIPTSRQFDLWRAGLFAMAGLVGLCALATLRRVMNVPERDDTPTAWAGRVADWLRWGGLAFVPSVMMLGVTAHLTTDLAAVPLLWVVPLGLYLISMILAFTAPGPTWARLAETTLPALVVPTAIVLGVGLVQLIWIPLHLLTFFVSAFVMHGALARRRPDRSRLTEYYLALSIGGAAGGGFCALLAPALFDRLVEYPLALIAVCLVTAWRDGNPLVVATWIRILPLPAVAGLSTVILVANLGGASESWLAPPLTILASGLTCLAIATARRRPLRFALTLAELLGASGFASGINGPVVLRERNVFGVLTVTVSRDGGAHRLFHGSTLHGQQSLDPARRREPLTYFTRSGPIGEVFVSVRGSRPLRVGVTGVGVGTLASYALPGDEWTFYELDPTVIVVAQTPALFTYLEDCEADRLRIVQGDARLSILGEPDGAFDLLILDAFSSDAVPVHLLTREAVALYRQKLRPGGRLLFNLSNRYLDLAALVAALAADAGWSCRVRIDDDVSPAEEEAGKRGSIWAIVAAEPQGLGTIESSPEWRAVVPRAGARVWTDEASSLMDYLRLGTSGARRLR